MVSTRLSSSSSNVDNSTFTYEAGLPGPSRRNQPQAGCSTSGALQVVPVNMAESPYINLLDLPIEILQKVLGYLDYNAIAHLRRVSIK